MLQAVNTRGTVPPIPTLTLVKARHGSSDVPNCSFGSNPFIMMIYIVHLSGPMCGSTGKPTLRSLPCNPTHRQVAGCRSSRPNTRTPEGTCKRQGARGARAGSAPSQRAAAWKAASSPLTHSASLASAAARPSAPSRSKLTCAATCNTISVTCVQMPSREGRCSAHSMSDGGQAATVITEQLVLQWVASGEQSDCYIYPSQCHGTQHVGTYELLPHQVKVLQQEVHAARLQPAQVPLLRHVQVVHHRVQSNVLLNDLRMCERHERAGT